MENLPRLKDIIVNTRESREVRTEVHASNPKLNFLKKYFDLESILKLERIFDLVLKFCIIGFIGYILFTQIKFVNNIILKVGSKELILNDFTIQIFITGTIVEFIWGVKIIINSLFPEGDRKNSLDFMKGEKADIKATQLEEDLNTTN